MDTHAPSDTLEQELRETIAGATDVLVLNPPVAAVHALVSVLDELDESPDSRVLAAESALKSVRDHVSRAAHAADLVDDEILQLRSLDDPDPGQPSLIVADGHVHSLIVLDSIVMTISDTDATTAASVRDAIEARWSEADAFDLRTPGWSRLLATLEAEFEPAVASDFERVLGAIDDADVDGTEVDGAAVAIFAAAANEALLYDIGRWGEDTGFASKATFSRVKSQMEDAGLLTTEKVPIDVGRPRLRLQIADGRLRDAEAVEVLTILESELT